MQGEGAMVVSLVFMLVPLIVFAIGNGFIAGRLKRSVPLWVILSIIPVIGHFFAIYVFYVVVVHVIDRLKEISQNTSVGTVSREGAS